jgi:hypothetical protein
MDLCRGSTCHVGANRSGSEVLEFAADDSGVVPHFTVESDSF